MTDILGLIFVLVGLVVYRFGAQLAPIFARIGAGGQKAAAASIRGRGSINVDGSSMYALAEHRKPLLDLEEEADEGEGGDVGKEEGYRARRQGGGGGSRGGGDDAQRGKKKPGKVVENEWEM